MTIGTINFQVLDVGQGTGNFIESFDTTGALVNTVLIDLGSEYAKSTAGEASAKWVADELNTMATPTLDAILLSHSDSDHINLLADMLAYFNVPGQPPTVPPKKDLLIKAVYYGGDRAHYTKGKKKVNIINVLETYMKAPANKAKSLPCKETSYFDPKKAAPPYLSIGGVNYYLLCVNVPKVYYSNPGSIFYGVLDSFAINTMSMIVVVEIGTYYYMTTGDATGTTLAYCNDVMKTYADFNTSQLKNNLYMMTIPHHGSEVTLFKFTGSKLGRGSDAANKNLTNFVGYTKPKSFSPPAPSVNAAFSILPPMYSSFSGNFWIRIRFIGIAHFL